MPRQVREIENRLHMAAQVWLDAKALQAPWTAFVRGATLPLELAHALHVLDANMAPTVRTRTWGIERSGRWRHVIVSCVTIASVANQLILLDECCAWDAIEKALVDPKKAAAHPPPKSARNAPRVRPRMGVGEFAVAMGERSPLLDWCEYAPAPNVLRAGSGGDLFTLTPSEGGGWSWSCCGKHDPPYTLDLRGLSPAEAKGARLTVWYEEERGGKLVDVPYVGVVLSVHMRDGMAVQFPDVIVDGKPEELVIGNEV